MLLLLILAGLLLLGSWFCYYLCFHVTRRQKRLAEGSPLPEGKIYEPYHPQMLRWMHQVHSLPCRKFELRSFDGLTLRGNYYEYAPGAPVELMFHGYRGSGERDLCGGVQRCFELGHSAWIVEQRSSPGSDGHTITFGVRESRDCHDWVDLVIRTLGPDVKIILTGISMGATTVLMAAGQELPSNVVGVLADCGFTSAREIIQTIMKKIHVPRIVYPFIRLGAFLFGGFDLHQSSALEAMANCRLPVIFFHGEDDDFVPCDMSRKNYEACTAVKAIYTVPGAGHGLSYPADPESYLQAVRDFEKHWGL